MEIKLLVKTILGCQTKLTIIYLSELTRLEKDRLITFFMILKLGGN